MLHSLLVSAMVVAGVELGHFGCRGRVCSGRRGAQLRPRRRTGALSLRVQKSEAGARAKAGERNSKAS